MEGMAVTVVPVAAAAPTARATSPPYYAEAVPPMAQPLQPSCYADLAHATEAWPADSQSLGHSNTDSAGHSFDWQVAQRTMSQLSQHSAYSAAACSENSEQYESGDRSAGRQTRSKAERLARRQRRRAQDGQTIVTTPWFPDGAVKEQVTLALEVSALAALLQLSPKERAARSSVRATMQSAAQQWWPESTVKVYGSYAYDCSLPDSALDLVCENCVDLAEFTAAIGHIARERGLRTEHLYEGAIGGERQAFARLHGEGGVAANVTFVEGRSPARQAVSAVQRLLAQYPAAREVFAVVRQVLRQSKVADAADGGLAPYAVLLMVLHAAQRSSAPEDPGQLLVDFFTLYSAPPSAKIDARSDAPAGRAPRGCPLWVCDLAGDGNVADGCTKVAQVHAVCLHCANTLAKWSSGQWQGYRGRSPLSSILAYDVLWERANA